jgi:hypothetical protein
MKKAARCPIAFFLLVEILTLLAPGLTVKAQPIQIVIRTGQYFTYGTSDGSPWITMFPSDAPALTTWDKFMNVTTWNFTAIQNPDPVDYPTQIWFNETVKFSNGTAPQTGMGSVDIDTAAGPAVVFFVPVGLQAGMKIYPGSSNFTWTINETRIDHTHWPDREICVLNHTLAQSPAKGTNPFAIRTVIYWDWLTGVLLSAFEEAIEYSVQLGAYIKGYLLYQLIANNAGIPMNYPSPVDMTPIYIAIAIASTVAVAIVIIRVTTSKPKKMHKRLKD